MPLLDSYIPLKSSKPVSANFKPPQQLKRERNRLWTLYKSQRASHGRHSLEAQTALNNFNSVNSQFRNFHIVAQKDYEESLVNNLSNNPKAMHQYVRRKKVSAPTVGPLKLVDGSVTTDCLLMAEIFADSFASVFKNEHLSPAPHQRSDSQIEHIVIHRSIITHKLSLLD